MYIVIFITAGSKKEAEKIARGLLSARLVACVNIVDGVESFFWWKNKIDRARECLLIMKSTEKKLKEVIKIAKSLHSYDVPEIIALSVIGGNKPYLDWIDDSIR